VRPGAENAQNELPEAIFGHMCGQGLKIFKMSFLRQLLAYVRPGAENTRNELPEPIFGHICGLGLKRLKMRFLRLLLAICAARG